MNGSVRFSDDVEAAMAAQLDRYRRWTGPLHEEGCNGSRCASAGCGLRGGIRPLKASSPAELDKLKAAQAAEWERVRPLLDAELASRSDRFCIGRYPTGWPVRARVALDEVRRRLDGLRLGGWVWYRHGGDGFAPGTFVVYWDSGEVDVFGSPVELVSAMGCEPVKAPRVAKPKPVAPVVQVDEVAVQRAKRATPDGLAAYLDRLVYGPKREYAAAYSAWKVGTGPKPADPGRDWAPKVRVKVDRLVGTRKVEVA